MFSPGSKWFEPNIRLPNPEVLHQEDKPLEWLSLHTGELDSLTETQTQLLRPQAQFYMLLVPGQRQ